MSVTINFHGAKKAQADRSGATAWLWISDGGSEGVTIFMDYDKAVAMAEVFNARHVPQVMEAAE